jgi:hypothetical protein
MLKTRSGLPKHCTYQPDRNGKRRVRFRRRGVSVYLTGSPWSEDFMRQYAAALEREQGQRAQIGAAKRTLPGSFSALCVAYYGSPRSPPRGHCSAVLARRGTSRQRRNRRVDHAPVQLQTVAVGAAESGASAVVHVEHRNAAAGPILNAKIERARNVVGPDAWISNRLNDCEPIGTSLWPTCRTHQLA